MTRFRVIPVSGLPGFYSNNRAKELGMYAFVFCSATTLAIVADLYLKVSMPTVVLFTVIVTPFLLVLVAFLPIFCSYFFVNLPRAVSTDRMSKIVEMIRQRENRNLKLILNRKLLLAQLK